jgi:DNA-binding SARP family transcriptional activator
MELSEDVEVDVRSARSVARRLSDPARGDEAADLGPFDLDLLPDWYEDWVIMERERYRQTRLHALEALCELLMARGQHAKAVDAGLTAVTGEPLRESAQRVLIRAHLAEGNLAEAVRQYRAYRELLRGELGVDGSPELEQLLGVSVR